jgi:uncharacterized protein DUF4235
MRITRHQRWTLVAGIASVIGVQVAERLLASSWRLARRKDPPYEPASKDGSWRTTLLWTAGVGALAGISDLAARRAAAVGWKRVTGKNPPRPRKRRRARS